MRIHSRIPFHDESYGGLYVGKWCRQQQQLRDRGVISQKQQQQLEELMGWDWDQPVMQEQQFEESERKREQEGVAAYKERWKVREQQRRQRAEQQGQEQGRQQVEQQGQGQGQEQGRQQGQEQGQQQGQEQEQGRGGEYQGEEKQRWTVDKLYRAVDEDGGHEERRKDLQQDQDQEDKYPRVVRVIVNGQGERQFQALAAVTEKWQQQNKMTNLKETAEGVEEEQQHQDHGRESEAGLEQHDQQLYQGKKLSEESRIGVAGNAAAARGASGAADGSVNGDGGLDAGQDANSLVDRLWEVLEQEEWGMLGQVETSAHDRGKYR